MPRRGNEQKTRRGGSQQENLGKGARTRIWLQNYFTDLPTIRQNATRKAGK